MGLYLDVAYLRQINVARPFEMILFIRLRVGKKAVIIATFVVRVTGQAVKKPLERVIQSLETILQDLDVNLLVLGQFLFQFREFILL